MESIHNTSRLAEHAAQETEVTRLLRLTITIEPRNQSLLLRLNKLLMAELADSLNEVFQRLP